MSLSFSKLNVEVSTDGTNYNATKQVTLTNKAVGSAIVNQVSARLATGSASGYIRAKVYYSYADGNSQNSAIALNSLLPTTTSTGTGYAWKLADDGYYYLVTTTGGDTLKQAEASTAYKLFGQIKVPDLTQFGNVALTTDNVTFNVKVEALQSANLTDSSGATITTVSGISNLISTNTIFENVTPTGYVVRYDSMGGASVDSSFVTNSSVTLPKVGDVSVTWYKDSALTNSFGASTETKQVTSNLKLYAKYTANKIAVFFDGDGATSGTTQGVQYIDVSTIGTKTINVPTNLVRTGYTYNNKFIVTLNNVTTEYTATSGQITFTYSNGTLTSGTGSLTLSAGQAFTIKPLWISTSGSSSGSTTTTNNIGLASISIDKYSIKLGDSLPTVTSVRLNGVSLTSSDYSYQAYSHNDWYGRVEVKGKGNYTGTKSITFAILPGDMTVSIAVKSTASVGGTPTVTSLSKPENTTIRYYAVLRKTITGFSGNKQALVGMKISGDFDEDSWDPEFGPPGPNNPWVPVVEDCFIKSSVSGVGRSSSGFYLGGTLKSTGTIELWWSGQKFGNPNVGNSGAGPACGIMHRITVSYPEKEQYGALPVFREAGEYVLYYIVEGRMYNDYYGWTTVTVSDDGGETSSGLPKAHYIGADGKIIRSISKSAETSFNPSTAYTGSTPTKTGWTFSGWNTTSTATTTLSSVSMPASGDLLLYAIFTQQRSANYNANGGSGAPSVQKANAVFNSYGNETPAEITISSTAPTRKGYTFKGWATNQNATTPDYTSGETIELSATSTTLYAVWELGTLTISIQNATNYYYDYGENSYYEQDTEHIWHQCSNCEGYSTSQGAVAGCSELSYHSFAYWYYCERCNAYYADKTHNYTGTSVSYVDKETNCSACSGTGKGTANTAKCSACSGTGNVGGTKTCTACNGGKTTTTYGKHSLKQTSYMGLITHFRCSYCGAEGSDLTTEIFNETCSKNKKTVTCSTCNGNGIVSTGSTKCSSCSGSGYVSSGSSSSCVNCSGSGKVTVTSRVVSTYTGTHTVGEDKLVQVSNKCTDCGLTIAESSKNEKTCTAHTYYGEYTKYTKVYGDGDSEKYISCNYDKLSYGENKNYYYSQYGAVKPGNEVKVDGLIYVVESVNETTNTATLKKKAVETFSLRLSFDLTGVTFLQSIGGETVSGNLFEKTYQVIPGQSIKIKVQNVSTGRLELTAKDKEGLVIFEYDSTEGCYYLTVGNINETTDMYLTMQNKYIVTVTYKYSNTTNGINITTHTKSYDGYFGSDDTNNTYTGTTITERYEVTSSGNIRILVKYADNLSISCSVSSSSYCSTGKTYFGDAPQFPQEMYRIDIENVTANCSLTVTVGR